MNRRKTFCLFSVLLAIIMLFGMASPAFAANSCGLWRINNAPPPQHANGLPLSDRAVKITSQGRTATFRLYDTVAAKNCTIQITK